MQFLLNLTRQSLYAAPAWTAKTALLTQCRSLSSTSSLLKDTTAKKASSAKKAASSTKETTKKKSESLKKKTASKLEIKNKEKPKRGMSPFSAYYKDMFKQLHVDKAPITETLKIAREKWASETQDVIEKYNKLSAESVAAQNKLLEEWKEKYKRPLHGYNKFIKSKFASLPALDMESARASMKEFADEWKSYTEEQKKEWKDK